MKLVSENIDQNRVFVIINKDGMKISGDVNAKNCLKKEYMIKDLLEIKVIENLNVINHVMLQNIYFIKTVRVEEGMLINQLKNVVKMLMRKNCFQVK